MSKVSDIKREGSWGDTFRFIVASGEGGQRLDQFLAHQKNLVFLTRSKLQVFIRSGLIRVNELECKPGYRVSENDVIEATIPPSEPSALVPEDVFFEKIYDDDDLVVISKPPGLVVHPSCGHERGTLVHGLLFHCSALSGGSAALRPGIVHRLDKDTSGIMVVAKNDYAQQSLMYQFKHRLVEKTYLAILDGSLSPGEGRIDSPIGRHPVNRKKMAVQSKDGRQAATSWLVLEDFGKFSYVRLQLETGRTHQIRVHMASLGHPVTGDTIYGSKKKEYADLDVSRQCLHAYRLSFKHPRTEALLQLEAPLWNDMVNALEILRNK